jgi:hypothetical protein
MKELGHLSRGVIVGSVHIDNFDVVYTDFQFARPQVAR